MIRYHHHHSGKYIYKIEIPHNARHNENDDSKRCVDHDNAVFLSNEYIIREIIHISTNQIIYHLGLDNCHILYNYNLYNYKIPYYKTYNRAFTETQFEEYQKNKMVLCDNFPKVYTTYYNNGQINETFYHINGKIEGKYIQYDYNGSILCECNFVDGKLHGSCIIYNYDNKCFCCNKVGCINKKDYYEYFYDNGDKLNSDDYFLEYQLNNNVIPYRYQVF